MSEAGRAARYRTFCDEAAVIASAYGLTERDVAAALLLLGESRGDRDVRTLFNWNESSEFRDAFVRAHLGGG